MLGLNEREEFFAVLFGHIFVGVAGDRFQIPEPLSDLETVIEIVVRLIAYALVFVKL